MPPCTANIQCLSWENAEKASDSLEPAGHKGQQWIGQGALLCGGHCHQPTARGRIGYGEVPANEWGSRGRFLRSPENILKMETQPSVANAAWPSLTALGKQRAAQLLGYLTPVSRSAAPFSGAACSWWLRVISSMRFHVWSLFSVWQLLRLSESVSRLWARKWT